MKFSVCIDAIFRSIPAPEAIRLTHEAGFRAYEFWGWWDKDLEALYSTQHSLNMTPIAMCTRFFSLVDPTEHLDYLQGLKDSIQVAHKLGCKKLISQCGQNTNLPCDIQRNAMIKCLQTAAPILEKSGITLLIEPLNLLDHPGYYLNTSQEAIEVLKAVNSPNVKMLFDIYHQQITEGDLIRHILGAMPLIGHFHAAGNPGRAELSSGEINYKNVFSAIRMAGYEGYVGLEYFPMKTAKSGLDEIKEMII